MGKKFFTLLTALMAGFPLYCADDPTEDETQYFPKMRLINASPTLDMAQLYCHIEVNDITGGTTLRPYPPAQSEAGSQPGPLPFRTTTGYGVPLATGDTGPCYLYDFEKLSDISLTNTFIFKDSVDNSKQIEFVGEPVRWDFYLNLNTFYSIVAFGSDAAGLSSPIAGMIYNYQTVQVPESTETKFRFINLMPDVIDAITVEVDYDDDPNNVIDYQDYDIPYSQIASTYWTVPVGDDGTFTISEGNLNIYEDFQTHPNGRIRIFTSPGEIVFRGGRLYTILITGYKNPAVDPLATLNDSVSLMVVLDNPDSTTADPSTESN